MLMNPDEYVCMHIIIYMINIYYYIFNHFTHIIAHLEVEKKIVAGKLFLKNIDRAWECIFLSFFFPYVYLPLDAQPCPTRTHTCMHKCNCISEMPLGGFLQT